MTTFPICCTAERYARIVLAWSFTSNKCQQTRPACKGYSHTRRGSHWPNSCGLLPWTVKPNRETMPKLNRVRKVPTSSNYGVVRRPLTQCKRREPFSRRLHTNTVSNLNFRPSPVLLTVICAKPCKTPQSDYSYASMVKQRVCNNICNDCAV
jgi:hypothetical protein